VQKSTDQPTQRWMRGSKGRTERAGQSVRDQLSKWVSHPGDGKRRSSDWERDCLSEGELSQYPGQARRIRHWAIAEHECVCCGASQWALLLVDGSAGCYPRHRTDGPRPMDVRGPAEGPLPWGPFAVDVPRKRKKRLC